MLRPTEDYALVIPEKRALSKTLAVVTRQSDQGTVGEIGALVAVGPGKTARNGKRIPISIAAADVVLYGGNGLGAISFPTYFDRETEYKIIQEADVCAIISKDGEITPILDRVIIRGKSGESISPGGIVVLPSEDEKPESGEVVAAGPGRFLDTGEPVPMSVKAGDQVMFSKYAGQEVTIKGEKLLVMREEDIFGLVEQ